MAVAEQEKTQSGGSGAGSAALKAAAAAAATGAATYAVKKVRSHDGGGGNGDGDSKGDSSRKSGKGGGQSIFASAAQTSWEAASDALMPLAEDAAEAAGKYLATHGPEIVRDRIVPKFIEAFNDAK